MTHVAELTSRADARTATFGVIGMECAFEVLHEELVRRSGWPLPVLVRRMTLGPADVVGIAAGRLFEGPPALTVLDPDAPFTVRADRFLSRSRNCPFDGRSGRGRVAATLLGGVWTSASGAPPGAARPV